jgi:GNAT superfamily N-acetyltransferase
VNNRTVISGDEAKTILDDDTLRMAMERLAASNSGLSPENPEDGLDELGREEFRANVAHTLQHGAELREKGRFSIAVDNGKVAAMGANFPIGQTADGRPVHYITRLVTLPDHEGAGAARDVFTEIERQVQTENPGSPTALRTRMPAVRRLCEKHGYMPITVREFLGLIRQTGREIPEQIITQQEKEEREEGWTYYLRDPHTT